MVGPSKMLTMILSEDAVRTAFRLHEEVYTAPGVWSLEDRSRAWSAAHQAFHHSSNSDFDWLYNDLAKRWQVFRGGTRAPMNVVQACIQGLDQRFRVVRLTDFQAADLRGCWTILKAMEVIKTNTSSPSVVAISKFLHFWNPRLFVIVDRAVMWEKVLSRSWLKAWLKTEVEQVQRLVPHATPARDRSACDQLSYLGLHFGLAKVLRKNPHITRCFAEYIRPHVSSDSRAIDVTIFDGAAMEWLLLGLAEMTPCGVDIGRSVE